MAERIDRTPSEHEAPKSSIARALASGADTIRQRSYFEVSGDTGVVVLLATGLLLAKHTFAEVGATLPTNEVLSTAQALSVATASVVPLAATSKAIGHASQYSKTNRIPVSTHAGPWLANGLDALANVFNSGNDSDIDLDLGL